MSARSEINMIDGSVFSKILRFSLPLVLTNLLQVLFNVADMVVVGRFSSVDGAVGAVGATTALVALFNHMVFGASVGATVAVSNAVGSRDREESERAVHTSLLIGLICGLIGAAVGVFSCRTVLVWMDSDPALLAMSATYCRIYFAGMPFVAVLNYAVAVLRAKGDTTTPLIILAGAGVLNVILNIVFVAGFGMNVDGVALATVISNAAAMVAVMIVLSRDRSWCRFSFRKLRIDGRIARRVMGIGLPAGLQGALFAISNMFIQQAVNGFGVAVITGISIASNLEGFAYVAEQAVATAALTFTGQNIGARRYDRLGRVARDSYFANILICGAVSVGIFLLREVLARMYMNDVTADTALILDTVTRCSCFRLLPCVLCGFMEVGSALTRGLGRSTLSMVITLLGSCAFRVVWIQTVFAAYPKDWVLYIVMPISWAITALAHLICGTVLRRRFLREAHPLNPANYI